MKYDLLQGQEHVHARARAIAHGGTRCGAVPVRGGTATRRLAEIGICRHFMADIGSNIGTIRILVHGFMWFFGFRRAGKLSFFVHYPSLASY